MIAVTVPVRIAVRSSCAAASSASVNQYPMKRGNSHSLSKATETRTNAISAISGRILPFMFPPPSSDRVCPFRKKKNRPSSRRMHRTCTIWIGVERNHTVVSLYKGPDSVSTGNSQFSDGFPLTVFREYSFIYSFQFLEDRREIGKGNGDGFLPVHAHTPFGGQSGDGHGHSDPMVAVAVQQASPQRSGAFDHHPVRRLFHPRPQFAKFLRHRGDPVAFLHLQLGGVADHRSSLRLGGHHRQHGNLVDQAGNQ